MKKNIAILVTATWRFIDFVPQLLDGINRHFLPEQDKHVFLFTDKPHRYDNYATDGKPGVPVTTIVIDHVTFPNITLERYERYTKYAYLYKKYKHIFHLDADMNIAGTVTDKILGTAEQPITAVTHPLFWDGGGTWEMRTESAAYIPKELRKKYFCGGVQGGMAEKFLEVCAILAARVNRDKTHNIVAEWHDESHWNWWCANNMDALHVMDAGYCYPQEKQIPFEKIIVALDKDKRHYRQ